jgi:hypothetical protein
MISGVLSSRCGNATSRNALGVDSNGNLALFASGIPGPPNVTWYLGVGFGPNGAPIGAYLRNKLTGGFLYAYWKNGYLMPFLGVGPLNVLDGWSTWSFGGPRDDGFLAVRPTANDDYNLNILGGCGGTQVGLWGWGGGNANEIWIFSPDPVQSQPSRYQLFGRCGGFMDVDASNRVTYDGTFKRPFGLPIPFNLPAPYTWNVEVAMGRTRLQKIPYPLSGCSFISPSLNKAVKANGPGQAVTLVDLGSINEDSAWNTEGTNGEGYMALRPLTDDDWNLNISGGCGGTQMITYPWTGGNWNELWRFAAV